MSWDITCQKLPDVPTVADIPDDAQLELIGSRDSVIAQIVAVVPNADFSDPTWGVIEGSGWSIEVNIGKEQECTGFMLHVRGGVEEAIEVISAILDSTNLRGIDLQTGDFFARDTARESFAQWQSYRDQVAREYQPQRGWFARLFGR